MRIAVIALTKNGIQLAQKVTEYLNQAGYQVKAYKPAHLPGNGIPFDEPLGHLVAREFALCQGVVLIMALGIAVRVLAPHLRSKTSDPAVVVMDEKGLFTVSVLSGHLGGANQLAKELAAALGSVPVITTATDVQGFIAVDVLAKKYNLAIESLEAAKKVNASLVNGGDEIHISSEFPLPLPEKGYKVIPWQEALREKFAGWLVLITNRIIDLPSPKVLFLRPRNLVAGIGCKKGVSPEMIKGALEHALQVAGRSPASLRALATVELRAKEEGLLQTTKEMGIALKSFTKEEIGDLLDKLPHLSNSAFVKQKIGVGGVCEPAALLAAPRGQLILSKTKMGSVTVALAEESYGWWEQDREARIT